MTFRLVESTWDGYRSLDRCEGGCGYRVMLDRAERQWWKVLGASTTPATPERADLMCEEHTAEECRAERGTRDAQLRMAES